MPKYLLVQSKSPAQSEDVAYLHALARSLSQAGHSVTLLLVDDAVVSAKKRGAGLEPLLPSNVHVVCDGESLRARGLDAEELCEGVQRAVAAAVLDAAAGQAKTLWH